MSKNGAVTAETMWEQIVAAADQIRSNYDQQLRRKHGLTLTQVEALSVLTAHPEGVRVVDLARGLRAATGNTTRLVDRMVRDDLAERASHPGDRRALLVKATTQGRAAQRKASPTLAGLAQKLGELLSDKEVRDLHRIFLRLRGAFGDPAREAE